MDGLGRPFGNSGVRPLSTVELRLLLPYSYRGFPSSLRHSKTFLSSHAVAFLLLGVLKAVSMEPLDGFQVDCDECVVFGHTIVKKEVKVN